MGGVRLRTRRLMAVPVLALAVIAAVTALVAMDERPAWLKWLPPWAATVTAGVLGVLGVWGVTPWATRRKAAAEREELALETLRAHLGRQGHLARIGETSARALALRVHPALPLPPSDHSVDPVPDGLPTWRPRWLRLPHGGSEGRSGVGGLDRDLPTFVERDMEPEIREAMRAACGSGGFIVLVGNSCVGKTRLLYQLANQELKGFAVLAPDLGDGNLVNDVAAATFPLPKLIIWLDELHRFLQGPYLRDDDEKAITAASVRQLLQAPTPVVILGAMWPEHANQLRATRPDPATGEDQPVYPRTVEILNDARVKQFGLRSFSDAERTAAAQLAATDARLAAALGDRTYNITETLAGAPELMNRYERATQEQQAIIHAAADARRLGIQAPLTPQLLASTARGYLNTVHPDDAWFPAALKEISTADRPQDRATAPLIAVLNPQLTEILGYTVADYLLQHLTRQRRRTHLPALAWQALTDYPHSLDDLARLADSARRRLLYRYTEPLHQRCLEAGDWADATSLLVEQGRTDEAISLLRPPADAGDKYAAIRLAGLLVEQGRTDEAISLQRERVDAGDEWAAWELTILLAGLGRTDELRERADAGDEWAAGQLAGLLAGLGRTDELRERADAGDEWAEPYLVALLAEQGRTDELRERADAGDGPAAERLAGFLVELGRTDEAISLLRQRAGAGDDPVAEWLTRLRESADAGDRAADAWLADLLIALGRTDELRERADAGDWVAASRLADLLAEQGFTDELRERADAGDWAAADRLAGVLVRRGCTDEAFSLLRERADAGDDSAASRLADLLAEQGFTDELSKRADAGEWAAADRLAGVLVEQGRTDELRERADAGDWVAASRLTDLLAEQGRTDELRHEVAAGTTTAGQRLISMLTADEETKAEGERLRRFGLNPDGSIADGTAEKN
jgi:predicted negative regulator of RcsB-dependent stress response